MNDYEYAYDLLNSPDVDKDVKDDFEREITKVRIQRC